MFLDFVTKEIVSTAIECDLPLELNLNQIRVKPHLYQKGGLRYKFWEYVGTTNAKVIINFDAHFPEFLGSSIYNQTLEMAKELGHHALKEGLATINAPVTNEFLNEHFSLTYLTPKEKRIDDYLKSSISTFILEP